MSKFIVLIMMAGLASVSFAGQNFTDNGADHLWSNPDNWASGVVPNDSTTHPSLVDPQWHTDVTMSSDGTVCLIDSSVSAASFSLQVGAYGGGNPFEMTGGSLTVGNWGIDVGRGGNDNAGHTDSFGHFTMTGGIIDAPYMNIPNQWGTGPIIKGEASITGGIFNANWIGIGQAVGVGSLTVGGNAVINLASSLILNKDGAGTASLDISGNAIMNIVGGHTNPDDLAAEIELYEDYAAVGWLTANGGADMPVIGYDDSTDMITIAVPEPTTLLLLGLGGLFIRRKNR